MLARGSHRRGGATITHPKKNPNQQTKNNIKRKWWRSMVQMGDAVVGIETSIIMNPRVWQASGHVDTFADPMSDCKSCKRRFRADERVEHKMEAGRAPGHAADRTGGRAPGC